MTFRRRGGRKLIVAPDGSLMSAATPRFNVDNVLVKALARGFRWRKLLDDGTYSTIKEIAAKEKIDAVICCGRAATHFARSGYRRDDP